MNKKSVPKKKKQKKSAVKPKINNRELSWLSFNARVLQEAQDIQVPLVERIKFLGIFSNNLDEFYRVRVAAVRRISMLKAVAAPERKKAKKLLEQIKKTVLRQQHIFDEIYSNRILPELRSRGIEIIDETTVTDAELKSVRQHFVHVVSQKIFPLILDETRQMPALRDGEIYLAVRMHNSQTGDIKYALVGIPSPALGRFYILPSKTEKQRVMLLDDIIRCSLDILFKSLDYDIYTSHTIKITRDAELDLDSEVAMPLLEKVEKSLKQRKTGVFTRFLYDEKIPEDLLAFFKRKLALDKDNTIPGGKYHNFRDFIKFPMIGGKELRYPAIVPHRVKELDQSKSLLNEVEKHDVLLSYPYQSFDYVIRLLREAAIDPSVFAIHISLYRIAENSSIAEALINAVHNGKHVTVVMELRARFMEQHNISWANRLKEEGAKVVYGIPNRKIHSKLIVISRRKNYKTSYITHIGTGNFNEDTARQYCDHSLITSRKRISSECLKVFEMIENFKPEKYKFNSLWVSPVNTRTSFETMMAREMSNAKKGLPARAIIKVNSLADESSCQLIYKAARAGVKVDLIVRGICVLGLKGNEPNIRAISVVDRFLEHARVFYFENAGKPRLFIGSADLMQRNIEYRVEVTTPILDPGHKEFLISMLELQLKDNVKARILDSNMRNQFVSQEDNSDMQIRSQEAMNELFRKKREQSEPSAVLKVV